MKKDLKTKIEEFNKIKYPKDNSKRIILAVLEPETVTLGCIYKE